MMLIIDIQMLNILNDKILYEDKFFYIWGIFYFQTKFNENE